jgi:hypothetical protein
VQSGFKNFDLNALRRKPEIAFYFRYPLYHSDFHEIRENSRLLGRFTAKPLYGQLTPDGKVDRSAGYNGQVAIIFIPARSRSVRSAQLVLTETAPETITLPNGRRNWTAINQAAEKAIQEFLEGTHTEERN